MASLDGLRIRKYLSESKVARLTCDGPVALRISYDGDSTSAPVISIITATSLTLTTSLGATVYTFGSGFGTLTLLADGINSGVGDDAGGASDAAGGGFTCRILDALPSTITTASNLIVSAGLVGHVVEGETVYDAMLDTSTTKVVAYRISQDRNVVPLKPTNGKRVKLVNFSYNLNVSAPEAGAVRIYEYNKLDGSTNLVWAATSVAATLTTHDFAANPLTASEGKELIVYIMDTTSITDSLGVDFLQVSFIRE